MGQKMSIESRRELLNRIRGRYRESNRKEKQSILDEFIVSAGYGRKYAVTLLNHGAASHEAHPKKRRPRLYDDRVVEALVGVWRAANRICSKRLVPFLPDFVAALERFGHLSLDLEVRKGLLALSPATVDRLLEGERHREGKGKSVTRPGSLIKRQIAIRTFSDWSDVAPGFFEADLVAHCGESIAGSFLHTLVLTDIATGWTECLALLHRSETDVTRALDDIRQALPFPLLGLDSDNGSEFINYEMLHYCQREKITFTRSRSYRKNDQAHVEEKNGSIVRRLIGYDRYEGVEAWQALHELYVILRPYVNFFQPSMKLLQKTRNQGHVSKRYDSAQTPYQRLLSSKSLNQDQKRQLEQHYETLDPVALMREVEHCQDRFWSHAHGGTSTDSTPQPSPESTLEIAVTTSPIAKISGGPRFYRRTPRPSVSRYWRTRKDPFEQVWPQVRIQLQLNPEQTAKKIFQEIQKQYPETFPDGQLRTLQRRVRDWRREYQYLNLSLRNGFYANPVQTTSRAPL